MKKKNKKDLRYKRKIENTYKIKITNYYFKITDF